MKIRENRWNTLLPSKIIFILYFNTIFVIEQLQNFVTVAQIEVGKTPKIASAYMLLIILNKLEISSW